MRKMTAALTHRGPDGSGAWLDDSGISGLGHTRLSIIDLVSGDQPMLSNDGRYVIAFNGEIYNYRSIRTQLERLGRSFRTNSDTEVLLEAYIEWGEKCLDRFNGMFAFAIYDRRGQELFLARDKVGIKPLYYHDGPAGFYFASEPKSILSNASVPRRFNYAALHDYLVYGYPLHPKTFFLDIQELEPGSWLRKSDNSATGRYWTWEREEGNWSLEHSIAKAEEALDASIQDHLVSDVPVGAFLSGGIDSSLVVAFIARSLDLPFDTFNVKFGEPEYDESPYAREVASCLGTRHHQITLDVNFGDLSEIDKIMNQFDQPFADSSAIPTFFLSREIRKHVKVVLSGDGGDEMFGGYPRFYFADAARRLGRLPNWFLTACELPFIIGRPVAKELSRKVLRMLRVARERGARRLITLFSYNHPDAIPSILSSDALRSTDGYKTAKLDIGEGIHAGARELIDATVGYDLPGDYLRKVDFMSSAHGLEVRVPFLGSQILRLASSLPHKHRFNRKTNKIILRRIASKLLPRSVVEKPKFGFGIPLDTWFDRADREAIRDYICNSTSPLDGLVSGKWLEEVLNAFVTGKRDRARWSRYYVYQQAYSMYSLARWLEKWRPEL